MSSSSVDDAVVAVDQHEQGNEEQNIEYSGFERKIIGNFVVFIHYYYKERSRQQQSGNISGVGCDTEGERFGRNQGSAEADDVYSGTDGPGRKDVGEVIFEIELFLDNIHIRIVNTADKG